MLRFLTKLIYLLTLSHVLLTDTSESLSVPVYINSHGLLDQRLPDDVNVTIRTDVNTSTELQLKRVEHISSNVPVYSVAVNNEGGLLFRKRVLQEKPEEETGYYQDVKHEAVIQMLSQVSAGGRKLKPVIARGTYRHDGILYNLQPITRSKRGLSQDSNQSDQSYEIRKVKENPSLIKAELLVPLEQVRSVAADQSGSKDEDGKKYERPKRATLETYFIKMTPYVHYTAYRRFLSQSLGDKDLAVKLMTEYYAFVFAGVDLIYQNLELSGTRLRVKLVSINYFDSLSSFPLNYIATGKVNVNSTLNTFTSYLSNKVTGYGHASLFVGESLWSNATSPTDTLTWVKTLCRMDGYSSSAVEDMGDYTSITNVALSLAFSMSVGNDGENNNCKPEDRYLMGYINSPATETNKLNPWRFSNCSKSNITSFIFSLEAQGLSNTCLKDDSDSNLQDMSQRLLGQEIPPNKQCQLKYGSFSYNCQYKNETLDMCTEMYCYNPNTINLCYQQRALVGTSCECGKVCLLGACVSHALLGNINCNVKDTWSNCTLSTCLDKSTNRYCLYTCANYIVYSSLTTTPKTTTTILTTKVSTSKTSSNTAGSGVNWSNGFCVKLLNIAFLVMFCLTIVF
nr:A disintegrin and metalloproteinase with thrombospondin motifs 2-like [Biomphalaria glabrata]